MAVELLTKNEGRYANTAEVNAFLVPGHPADLSGAIRYNRDVYPAWGHLLKLVQTQRAPRWLLKLLLGERLRRRNWVWLPYLVYNLYSALGYLQAGLRALFRGDWAAFRRAFRAHFVGPDRDLQVYQGALGEARPAQE